MDVAKRFAKEKIKDLARETLEEGIQEGIKELAVAVGTRLDEKARRAHGAATSLPCAPSPLRSFEIFSGAFTGAGAPGYTPSPLRG